MLQIPSPALRAGLRALLSTDTSIKVVAAPDVLEEDDEADVIITSASRVPFAETSMPILYLSDEHPSLTEMQRAHRVWGILPTDSAPDELIAAIHALAQGLVVGAPGLLFESDNASVERGPLTDRESEVLGLVAKGLANKQIAAALGISEHTVKFHVSSIYTKLNVTNRTEAVRAGLRGGWVAL